MIHTTQECRIGDALDLLRETPDESIDTVITSPPYWGLRDYGVGGQIGMEPTLEEYHERMLEVTAECMRVLKPTGVMFWNHGDSYGGSASQGFGGKGGTYADMSPHGRKRPKMVDKCLTMQNERLTIRMIDEQGWILRNRIIWEKPNAMPSSVTDRFSNKYEPVYMLVKSNDTNYYYNSKTGTMQRDKPLGTNGEEGTDWDWKEVGGDYSESDTKIQAEDAENLGSPRARVHREKNVKKVSNWVGRDYWFDLNAVRVPAKYAEVWSRKGAGKDTPYAQNNPRSRWGITRTEVKRSENAQKQYKTSGMRDPLGGGEAPNAFHPMGKNPGDVREMTQVEWLDHCADIWDMFADEQGDIMRIPTQPYPESHFATFPTSLIEPMIKAACPAEMCPVCGLARERIVDREFVPQQDVSEDKGVRGANDQKPMDASNQWQGSPRGTTAHHTAGWTSCDCDAGWVAGTVLDPFCGSGTVLEVCRLLNRNAIGFELNPEYELLIRERSMAHTPPLTAYSNAEQSVVVV